MLKPFGRLWMWAGPAILFTSFLRAGDPAKLPQPKVLEAPAAPAAPCGTMDINLAAALELAGLHNANILIAQERITEADALRQRAALRLLPDLNSGINFNSHTGPLQSSNGTIIEVNRSALYVGFGAGTVGAGTVAVPGIAWNAQLSEVAFGILHSRQEVHRRRFESDAVRNDILLQVGIAYIELLRAEARFAIAQKVQEDANEVVRLTTAYAQAGQGRQADADRATAELEQRNAEVAQAEGEIGVASARLCQLLDLDPSCRLHVVDGSALPHPVVPPPIPLCELIAMALLHRPELSERRVAIEQAFTSLRAAKVLPFSPTVSLGYSAGEFGGGSNLVAAGLVQPAGPRFGNFDDRQDFDVVMYWTLRNLGIGNANLVKLSQSRVRTSHLREIEVLDRVRAEVAAALARSQARLAQIDISERAIQSSQKAFERDLLRIRGAEGLPIEVLNSLRLLARSRYAYLDAICDFDRAQIELFVALGNPPPDVLARPIPADGAAPATSQTSN